MFTHELDAVRRHEWRVFPLTSNLPDNLGFMVFVLAHVPIFALVLWFAFPLNGAERSAVQMAFSGFCIAHVGLHKFYENHPAYAFNNKLSQILIWGAGTAGAAHLLLAFSL
jgi:hypothetical protein